MPRRSRLPLRFSLALFWAALLVAACAGADDSELKMVTLGTGSVTGIYYPVGKAICAVVNKSRRDHGIRCSEESTPGSVYNVERIADGELDFALVQSDVQFAAYIGQGDWHGRRIQSLRSILSLHPEVLTLLVRKDSPIASIADLRGKRVNVGGAGSGTRASWHALQTALGWQPGDLAQAAELRPDAAGHALCSGEMDASLLMVGHPSAVVLAELARCEQRIVPVSGDVVDQLIATHPYYAKVMIIAGTYGLATGIASFGGMATLVTTADQPDDLVYTLTKQIMTNLAELKAMNPALGGLVPEAMARAALTAPVHPGAERAFRELGLRK